MVELSPEKRTEKERVRLILQEKGIAFSNLLLAPQDYVWAQRSRKGSDGTSAYAKYLSSKSNLEKFAMIDKFYHRSIEKAIGGRDISYLDIGYAEGTRTKQYIDMLNRYCRVSEHYALDIDPEFIKEAKKNLGEENASVGNVLWMDFKNRFDLVTCLFGVLGHLEGTEFNAALRHIYDGIKSGGVLCFDVLKRGVDELRSMGYTKEDEKLGRHYIIYSPHDGRGNPVLNQEGKRVTGAAKVYSSDEIMHAVLESGFIDLNITEVRHPKCMTDYAVIAHK